jgi:hypothetical protein
MSKTAQKEPLPSSQVGIRLDADDRALLSAISDFERLRPSDIIRRAIRAYAEQLRIHIDR